LPVAVPVADELAVQAVVGSSPVSQDHAERDRLRAGLAAACAAHDDVNVYINQVDDGLGAADAWDEILDGQVGPSRGHLGATQPPDTAANAKPA
jgi:hypothetical protein